METDLAAVERAKLDLTYCQIRSPISGRAGNLLVHAGNLVKVNDVALVVINQIEPIFVSFGVPEQHLGAIRKNSSDRKLPVQVSLQEDPHKTAARLSFGHRQHGGQHHRHHPPESHFR